MTALDTFRESLYDLTDEQLAERTEAFSRLKSDGNAKWRYRVCLEEKRWRATEAKRLERMEGSQYR